MFVSIDSGKCQGHGRCYALAPEVFEPDDLGDGVVISGGHVPPELEEGARLAALNCPEEAIIIEEAPEATREATFTTASVAGATAPTRSEVE